MSKIALEVDLRELKKALRSLPIDTLERFLMEVKESKSTLQRFKEVKKKPTNWERWGKAKGIFEIGGDSVADAERIYD